MKYFGTDGIRGIVGKKIDEKLLKRLAKAVVAYLKAHNLPNKIVVGNDSRISSDYIFAVMQSIFHKSGVQTFDIGQCSSPCLAFVTKKNKFPLGMMISASHNPSEYNGIKFFDASGKKVDDKFEQELEILIEKNPHISKAAYTFNTKAQNLKNEYISMLKAAKKVNYPCILDCANGGGSEIAKQVFPSTKIINCLPNGKNINQNSGCTHIEMLANLCREKNLIGFAFDGDADRVVAVDKTGDVINGDKILYILSKFYLKSGDCLIGNINTNSGLAEALACRRIKLVRSSIGDRCVYQKMMQTKSMLGGEGSGHIIIKRLTNTGDGILTAICLMNILHLTNLSFKELLDGYHEYFVAEFSLPLEKEFKTTQNLNLLIDSYTEQGARIVVRPSGTEPVLRLLVEHKDKATANKMLSALVYTIKNLPKF